jgi:hypothetical protein
MENTFYPIIHILDAIMFVVKLRGTFSYFINCFNDIHWPFDNLFKLTL